MLKKRQKKKREDKVSACNVEELSYNEDYPYKAVDASTELD